MKALAIGAHFDDLEIGCSGTLIKHALRGDQVKMLVVTKSSYQGINGDTVRQEQTAMEEGEKAAKLVGAEMVCLGFDTFHVPFDEAVTSQIMQAVEEYEADIVYCHWMNDIHRDHQNVGKATLMAARHVPRVLMYRSNYYDSHDTFRGNFYSDISDVMERKIEVIKVHQSELERVRYKWLDFFKNQNANDGQRIGVRYAECFEVVRYLAE